jgi:hypothetical protein
MCDEQVGSKSESFTDEMEVVLQESLNNGSDKELDELKLNNLLGSKVSKSPPVSIKDLMASAEFVETIRLQGMIKVDTLVKAGIVGPVAHKVAAEVIDLVMRSDMVKDSYKQMYERVNRGDIR